MRWGDCSTCSLFDPFPERHVHVIERRGHVPSSQPGVADVRNGPRLVLRVAHIALVAVGGYCGLQKVVVALRKPLPPDTCKTE